MIVHFKGFSVVKGDMSINIDYSRFEKQYKDAQLWLDRQVMHDMIPFMPIVTGTFIRTTRARSEALAGTGKVIAGAPPMGRFLYMGKVMVDPETGSPWARKDAKKVVTDRPLTYSNPRGTPMWFDTAKSHFGQTWVSEVKRIAGGG